MKITSALLTALVLLVGAMTTPASERTTDTDLHVDLGLADGTRILGLASDPRLTLATAFGKVDLVLSGGDKLDSNDDQETMTLRTGRGDVLRCVIESPWLLVHPYGAAEPRKVSCSEIRSVRAMDPIWIAGSEGAAWEVAYENATGWTPSNREGCLTVTGIDADTVNSKSGGPWGAVRLTRHVEGRDDFELEADISWNDLGAGLRTMQNLIVSVVGEEGGLIAAVGHRDAWVGETGSRFSQLPGVARTNSSGSQPTRGRARLEIVRTGDEIKVLWDGELKHRGKSKGSVSRVEVQFDFNDYRNAGRNSAFGSVTLHRLELR